MTFQSFCHHSMGCPTRTSRANRSKLWVFLAEMTGGNPSATLKQTGPLLNHLLPKTLVYSMFVPPLSIRFLLLTYSMIHSLMINYMSIWLCIFFNDIQQSVKMKYGSTNNEMVQCSALPLLRCTKNHKLFLTEIHFYFAKQFLKIKLWHLFTTFEELQY